MLAVPEVDIQTTAQVAAPEILEYYLASHKQASQRKHIDFQAQDMWSLGCLLVWLITGTQAFTVTEDELAEANKTVREVLHAKHRLCVSLLVISASCRQLTLS